METFRRAIAEKTSQGRPNVKVLFIIFFHCYGVVYHEFLPQIRTVNEEYCREVTCQLREVIRQKRTESWKSLLWILDYDNALAYTLMIMRPQKRYSPDLAPANFFLFPKLKTPMHGKCFVTNEKIKEKSK